MRYIKKLALYRNDPMSDRFSVLEDNRVVSDTKVSLQVPAGDTSDRTALVGSDYNGQIRFNKSINEFEVYNYDNPGPTRWEVLRTVRQGIITPQNLGSGNYNDTIFGPLSYDIDVAKPQNLFVFVDNVYQIPTTNYTLTTNPSAATSPLSVSTSSGVTTLFLSTLTNIDVGTPGVWRTITAPSGIQVGTTVTNVSTAWNNPFQGYAVEISLPTTGLISSGTTITVSYETGTYIEFTSPAPARPIFALLGVDGYWPIAP